MPVMASLSHSLARAGRRGELTIIVVVVIYTYISRGDYVIFLARAHLKPRTYIVCIYIYSRLLSSPLPPHSCISGLVKVAAWNPIYYIFVISYAKLTYNKISFQKYVFFSSHHVKKLRERARDTLLLADDN